MEALLIMAFCAAICALFVAGWCIVTVGAAVMALIQGKPVYPAIKPFLEEW